MYTCILIEDQAPAQQLLQKYIDQSEMLILTKTFADALEAKEFLAKHTVDLVFLDINLPKLSGMDFLRSVPDLPSTILTTAYSDYALESYEYRVIDYLLKPFSYERFSQAIAKGMPFGSPHTAPEKPTENDYVYVKESYDLLKVNQRDIIYIKADADYTEVVTRGKKYLTSDSLKEWNLKLNKNFCQVHKSFIVNRAHLVKVSQNKIHLSNSSLVPIGRAFKKGFMEQLQ